MATPTQTRAGHEKAAAATRAVTSTCEGGGSRDALRAVEYVVDSLDGIARAARPAAHDLGRVGGDPLARGRLRRRGAIVCATHWRWDAMGWDGMGWDGMG
jgi:hypothetical protein